MAQLHSLLRLAEHRALSTVHLSGTVLDLGGDTTAEYRSELKGDFTITTVNLDTKTKPDIYHDLETPLPIADAQYDNVLLINVLEHIYKSQQLIAEAVRVLRPGGKLVIVVPFLFPLHPDPNDYWRFSDQTLRKELEQHPLADITITPLGSGVFAARFVMIDRLLPTPLRIVNYYLLRHLVPVLDGALTALAKALGKKYSPDTYALGYLVTAKRK